MCNPERIGTAFGNTHVEKGAEIKQCNHTSVGMIVMDKKEGDVLLIQRARRPFGFAPPAGHVESGEGYEQAAQRELGEEVGLDLIDMRLVLEGRRENSCRKDGGSWHYWKIYEVDVQGMLSRSEVETRQVGWFSKDEIQKLATRTEDYIRSLISESDWESNPGLEPVWYDFFKDLKII